MYKVILFIVINIFVYSSISYAVDANALPTPPTQDEIEEQQLQEKISIIFTEANKQETYECKNQMDVVKFPHDSRLLNCMRENKVFDRWPPTCKDAENVRELKCRDVLFNSLDGIQQFPNLEMLIIEKSYDNGTQISSLAPLRNLTKLNTLSLPASKISDIVFLTRLPSLRYLDLSHNQITDLTYIRLMKNLHSLLLRHQAPNYISDLTMLSKINGLDTLDLEGNKITDLTPITSHKSLAILNIRDNRVTTLEPLRNMPKLYVINFSINIVRDISPLADIKTLGGVYGRLNRINSIEPLRSLENLIEVDMRENFISDISPLDSKKNIQAIHMDYNLITDLLPIKLLRFNNPAVNLLGFSYNCIPEANYTKIWYFDQIAVKRFENQCKIPQQDNISFITDNIVNKDLVDYHNAENFEEVIAAANNAGVGGCSLGGGKQKDISMILMLIVLMLRVCYMIRVKRKITIK